MRRTRTGIEEAGSLLVPGLVVILSALACNLVGDGLRDAADPYAR
jgi:peptide/nickel transport system permease protein